MRAHRFFLAAALIVAAAPVSATTFTDGFEDETSGPSILNYTGFANWSVTQGSVDLIRSGQYGISCRSGSYCVDLDGSSGAAGHFWSRGFDFVKGDQVDIRFWLSGNQRGNGPDRVIVELWFQGPVDLLGLQLLRRSVYTTPEDRRGFNGGIGFSGLFEPNDPFDVWGGRFVADSPGRVFIRLVHWAKSDTSGGVSDNIGVILDDAIVSITSRGAPPVPEPATWAMLIAGFGLVGLAARRRRGRLLAD